MKQLSESSIETPAVIAGQRIIAGDGAVVVEIRAWLDAFQIEFTEFVVVSRFGQTEQRYVCSIDWVVDPVDPTDLSASMSGGQQLEFSASAPPDEIALEVVTKHNSTLHRVSHCLAN